MTTHARYLGDGLYASFDGFQVILAAPREGGDHWVGLEPATLDEFVKFLDSLRFDGTPAPILAALIAAMKDVK